MIIPGEFSAKLIQQKKIAQEPLQYGPLPAIRVPDPREELFKASLGKNDWYRANGAVEIPKEKIMFLGS